MTRYVTPCASPENDPQDWFIDKAGKQYVDDVFVSDDEMFEILEEADRRYLEGDERVDFIGRTKRQVAGDNKRAQLGKRRRAREKCRTECYLREQCLEIALSTSTPATHGTWGGYFEEELTDIRRKQRKRGLRR